MRQVNVRREELYELVWSKPRTTIAKELGISDVRVGKLCREMNVPAPPRGYWTNRDGKRKRRKFERPPLTYTLAERIEADHDRYRATRSAFNPKNLEEPVPSPPVLPDTFEEAMARYRLLLTQTSIPHATRGTHPVTQKFITEDERLAQLSKKSSWYEPKFASPQGKELLEGINRLLWFFQDLGFAPSASGQRHIVMYAARDSFEVAAIDHSLGVRRGKSSAPAGRFGFWYGVRQWERASAKPLLAFSQFSRNTLRSIALLIIEHKERAFREWVQRDYEWDVAERRRVLEEAEGARKQELQRRAAEANALRKARSELLNQALDGLLKSDQLRRLVDAMRRRLGDRSDPDFDRWRQWVLAQADELDLATHPVDRLQEWFQKFRLAEELG